ncbi:MAG: hypothetical protein SFV24_09635 [Gemmatimonadales bacterium]|nr:hypothetical protein [Gemmatimonadales bacterium]
MRGVSWLIALVLIPGALHAQLPSPPGWRWVTDGQARMVTAEKDAAGSADAMWFVQMPPGFHLTMGPGGNLFLPSLTVEGRFELESEFFLFPGSSQEEYGLFLGGRSLDGEQPEWVAFVARRDGSAAVLRRRGGSTGPLRDWRVSSGIVAGRTDGTARNVLKVAVGPEVVFSVNGAEVARLPRDSVAVDGVVGLRAGRGVNLHVTTFDLTRRIAPVPARRPQ